jgi:predicted MFS family arabinose efflux permease
VALCIAVLRHVIMTSVNTLFRAVYFVYFASLSAVHPFLSLLLKDELGLSARLVGVLLLVKPLVGVVGGAVLCGFADQHRCHRVVLLVSTAISAVAMQCIWWWSSEGGFGRILTLFSVIGFFSAAVSSIVDSLCAHHIKDSGCDETYGQIRLWGAVGWGTFAAVASILVEHASSWTPAFYLHGVFSMVTLFTCYSVATHVTFQRQQGNGDERAFLEKLNLLGDVGGFRSFVLLCVVFGTTTGAIEGFLFPFLATLPGATETLYGISLSVTCLSESLVFWKAGQLMRWIEGVGVVHICFAAFTVRLFAYMAMKLVNANAWIVLLIEPLHGLTFALTWTWLIDEAKRYGSSCRLESFCVAVATSAMFGCGYALGGCAAGMAFSMSPGLAFVPSLAVLLVGWRSYHLRASTTRPRLKAKLSGILDVVPGDVQLTTT